MLVSYEVSSSIPVFDARSSNHVGCTTHLGMGKPDIDKNPIPQCLTLAICNFKPSPK